MPFDSVEDAAVYFVLEHWEREHITWQQRPPVYSLWTDSHYEWAVAALKNNPRLLILLTALFSLESFDYAMSEDNKLKERWQTFCRQVCHASPAGMEIWQGYVERFLKSWP